ncbi:MAG: hypothetical protein QM539_10745 [Alphaproteobacteria bacterium]|nr:hypothetical protein [Alphaproteobacteria bacterium]
MKNNYINLDSYTNNLGLIELTNYEMLFIDGGGGGMAKWLKILLGVACCIVGALLEPVSAGASSVLIAAGGTLIGSAK